MESVNVGGVWQHLTNGYYYEVIADRARFDHLEAQVYVVMRGLNSPEYENAIWIRSREQFLQKFKHIS